MKQNNLRPLVPLSPGVHILSVSIILFRLLHESVAVSVLFLFCRIVSGFQLYVKLARLMVVLILNKSGNLLITLLFSDWLFSSTRMFPIVKLNLFNQYFPSSGVISFLSVIGSCIFCLLFSYSMSTGVSPQNLTSFLFTS